MQHITSAIKLSSTMISNENIFPITKKLFDYQRQFWHRPDMGKTTLYTKYHSGWATSAHNWRNYFSGKKYCLPSLRFSLPAHITDRIKISHIIIRKFRSWLIIHEFNLIYSLQKKVFPLESRKREFKRIYQPHLAQRIANDLVATTGDRTYDCKYFFCVGNFSKN